MEGDMPEVTRVKDCFQGSSTLSYLLKAYHFQCLLKKTKNPAVHYSIMHRSPLATGIYTSSIAPSHKVIRNTVFKPKENQVF